MMEEETEELKTEDSGVQRGPANKLLFVALSGAVVAVLLSAFAAWYFFFRGEGGEPVAAPRSVSFDNKTDSAEIPEGERVVTLTEEQLKASGIKIVTVGEDLASTAAEETTTGVVEPNEYRETPVISQVSGVVKEIRKELGSFVRRGEVIGVVSSNELAQVQADYLSRVAELDESRKRLSRSLELSEISEESRNELDRTTASLKAAEAKVAETSANLERSQKLQKIGAVSKRELEIAETAQAKAAAEKAEANKRYERAGRLLKVNPARKNEIDNFRTMVSKKQAEVGAMREKLLVLGLSRSRVNGLRSSENISADLPIVSPVAGTVTDRMANRGEVVSSNAELLSVTDLSTVWVIAQVFEKDIGKVTVGSGAGITSKAFPGEYFRGNVSYIDPELDQTTRTAKVRIELPNVGGRLKIGMYVNVALSAVGGREKTMPSVPKESVQFLGDSQVVFEATEDPLKFIIRPVSVLEEKSGRLPVSKGIFVGDKIVGEGSFLLRAEWLKTNEEG